MVDTRQRTMKSLLQADGEGSAFLRRTEKSLLFEIPVVFQFFQGLSDHVFSSTTFFCGI